MFTTFMPMTQRIPAVDTEIQGELEFICQLADSNG